MAGRRSRQLGQGMMPLFDIEAVPPPCKVSVKADRGGHKDTGPIRATAMPSVSVAYWIRGVFRFGDGKERTRTVDGVGMRMQLSEDATRFVAYLGESGWLFPEGRAVLVETLGIAADDGGIIILSTESK